MKKLQQAVLVGLYAIVILIIIFFLFLILDLFFFVFAQKNGEPNLLVDANTQKILYYVYGVRNLTYFEKLQILRASDYFPKNMKGDIDYADKIFPDKKVTDFDKNWILRFHKENGNPKIVIGCWSLEEKKSVYWQYRNLIVISPFDQEGIRPVSLDTYFNELAHAHQWTKEPIFNFFRHKLDLTRCWLATKVLGIEASVYNIPGTLEYTAHNILTPALEQEYKIYRQKYENKKARK